MWNKRLSIVPIICPCGGLNIPAIIMIYSLCANLWSPWTIHWHRNTTGLALSYLEVMAHTLPSSIHPWVKTLCMKAQLKCYFLQRDILSLSVPLLSLMRAGYTKSPHPLSCALPPICPSHCILPFLRMWWRAPAQMSEGCVSFQGNSVIKLSPTVLQHRALFSPEPQFPLL